MNWKQLGKGCDETFYARTDESGRKGGYGAICGPSDANSRLKASRTKQTDRQKAWEVCLAFVNAEEHIAYASPTEQQDERAAVGTAATSTKLGGSEAISFCNRVMKTWHA